MKKNLKPFIVVLMAIILMINFNTITSLSRGLSLNDENISVARVLEVIDGEAIKVITFSKGSIPQITLIKMIGIDTKSSKEAMEYSYTNLIGKTVMLMPDSKDSTFEALDGWIYRYVYRTSIKSFSEELLELGLAEINKDFIEADQYFDLLEKQSRAQKSKLGIWKDNESTKNQKVININTASSQDIIDTLEDTPSHLAYLILNYRYYNPYNTIEEIKFASNSFTSDWFTKNKDKLSVVTDVNTANVTELASLFTYSYNNDELAKNILQYRMFNPISSVTEMKDIKEIVDQFSTFEKFITLEPEVEYFDKDIKVANVNTALIEQIREVTNISEYRAKQIIDYRDGQNYIIKTIGELEKNNNGLYKYETNRLRDNLSVYTNVNTALEYELKSLFGSSNISEASMNYKIDKILESRPFNSKEELKSILGSYYNSLYPYYYTHEEEIPDYININLCNKETAINILDFDNATAETYRKTTTKYESSSEINFIYSSYSSEISLYTNINNASLTELKNLNSKMPGIVLNDIVEFRLEQPFTSLNEVSILFSQYGYQDIYDELKDYIIFY